MPAAASPSTSAEEAQKKLLLDMGLPFKSWRAGVPLGDFEGVTVAENGLINSLNFKGKAEAKFKLADFASLVSLKEINFEGCRGATGGCVW